MGAAGNVGVGSINTGGALPAGLRVTNPVRTWGGSRAETAAEGEKLIPRYLQHRDRLVSAADFEAITLRTPGVEIGRVEVIPAFNPDLYPNIPGDAPGAVTLLVIPRFDPAQPDAPQPDRLFINAVSRHIDPRRLVTTEVILRGPVYKGIWVSIGLNVVAGVSIAQVREDVRQAVQRFLSPLPGDPSAVLERQEEALSMPQYAERRRGWPLETAVTDRELMAEANRVRGVLSVNDVLLAEGAKAPEPQIRMNGLELPRILGLSITAGEPMNLDELRGLTTGAAGGGPGTGTGGAGDTFLPVPVIPEEC
jgi:predicted phage baseplate assembly protein